VEKENKIAGNVERLATLYSAIRAHLETRNQAGIAQQRWRREEGMQRSSGRATDGNNATRKGRRTGAMQRCGSDGRRTAAERRRTSACRAQGRSGEDLRERTGDVHGAVRDGTGVCELGLLWSVHARG